MLIEGVLGILSGAACAFTFGVADVLSFVGEPGLGVAGTLALALRETAEPVLRTTGVLDFDVAEVVGVELPERTALVVD